jgi:hypothetical protein
VTIRSLIHKMSRTEQIRIECDQRYLSLTSKQLEERYWKLNENNDFPKEINHPDNSGFLGRGFYISWNRGSVENKPSRMFDTVMKIQLGNQYDIWKEHSEQIFFENVHRVLHIDTQNNSEEL